MPNFAANILITMKPYPGNNIGREKLMHNNGMQTETIFYNPNDKRYYEDSPTYIGPNK
jgi:hypothetical protein